MNIIGDVIGWAKSAWNTITGVPSDIAHAIANVWHYVTSIHNVLSWLTANPVLRFAINTLYAISVLRLDVWAIRDALHRLAGWIWLTIVKPQIVRLDRRITVLYWWAVARFVATWQQMYRLYYASLAYTRQLVSIERQERIKADQAEHASMLANVAALHRTVEHEAASGYNAELHARLTIVGKLLDDLAIRNPVVSTLVKDLVTAVFDLESIDNPVLRFGIARLLAVIVDRAGIDRVTGDLITRLLGPVAGQPRAGGLYDVAKDTSARLTALEAEWAEFMTNGGPEVEQAGREWKDLTGVVADAGILAVFGLAVADPQAWATGMADTIGVAGNDTLDAIVGLLNRA